MAKVEYKYTTAGAMIAAMCDNIAGRSASLKTDMHVAAVSCIGHASLHGDVMYAQRLVEALGDGWRLNALRAWFIKFGPYTWVTKTKDKPAHFALDKAKRDSMKAEFEADEAAVFDKLGKVTFWDFKPEPEFEGFDLLKEAKKLVKKANGIKGDKDKMAHPDTKLDVGVLAALEAFVERGGAALN